VTALPEKIGKYEIQGILGRGGMGVVYKGYDRAIARGVAIKAISKGRLDEYALKHVVARFRHEAQAVGRLVHPRIVQIYDYGEDNDVAYIVMELVNGKPLSDHIMRENGYEISEVGEIIAQLLDGVGHAHAARVVHRDIKPANILLNSDGRIKLSDFGIARIESSNLTQIGDMLGTPHYMAPEQFLGAEIGLEADLYSVGVIAYELLTGRKPFTGNTAEVMQAALNEEPALPSSLQAAISPQLDQVLLKAMAKKASNRYRSAGEFAAAFSAVIEASREQVAPGLPDATALLGAARMIATTSSFDPTLAPGNDDMPGATGDSAISLDSSVKKGRLLVIDDEERILSALKSLFRDRYHVFATTDGNKALDFLRRYQMHVIISDQRMPVMTGVELLRRSREISPHSVRILLTGYSDLASIVGSINDGEIYRFISKPWDSAELRKTVAEGVTIALELANTKTATAELPEQMEAGVLVIDKGYDLQRIARELVGRRCPVFYAPDLEAALPVMLKHEIAVVIADVEAGHEQIMTMLKILKQENPQILTIVVTGASDSELVIELINQAQIFRFLNKPVSVRLLKGHVEAALQRYLTFRQTPQLLDAHRVQAAEGIRSSSLGQRILAGIENLRGRWFGNK